MRAILSSAGRLIAGPHRERELFAKPIRVCPLYLRVHTAASSL